MLFVLASILSAAPVMKNDASAAPARTGMLRTRIDFGGMILTYWYVPETRSHIEAALDNARGSLVGEQMIDGFALLKALPVAGPWAASLQEKPMAVEERALLFVTGVLQLAGLSLGAMQLAEFSEGPKAKGPVLSISPISAGCLGISVKLVGY